MPNLRATIRSHPIRTFYLAAFGISWVGWIPSLAAARGAAFFADPSWQVALVLPAIGPALAAGLTVRLAGEAASFRERLAELFRWRIDRRWYLFALVAPLVLLLAARALGSVLQPDTPMTVPPLSAGRLLVFGLLSLLANPWEEVGWRGFALARLQARHHAVVATLIVGALWAAWHAPIFLLPPGSISMAGIPYGPWAADLVARSFIMTWLYNRSGRSVLISAVFHVMMNGGGALIGVASYPILAGVEIFAAISLGWLAGPALGYKAGRGPT